MATIAKQTITAGAGHATLATAIANTNTAIATAVTEAMATTGYIDGSVEVIPMRPIFKDPLYVYSAAVEFYTTS